MLPEFPCSEWDVWGNSGISKPCAGKPVHVTLENLTADTISYEWTVGGKKISNFSDSYPSTEQDYEKLISCTVIEDGKEYTASMYFSELPIVYINTNDGQDVTSKEEYVKGTCSIQGNSEFTNELCERLHSGIGSFKYPFSK